MMIFTELEIEYLGGQPLGRLATVQPDGTVQNSPVSYRYNPELDTIDIGGYRMSASQKFRNLATNNRVALVVDDVLSQQPWRVRCLEIRGTAEQVRSEREPWPGGDAAFIRLHPKRIISFGLDQLDVDPHTLTMDKRTVG
jgi:pyridoxamine 5'-phosphate oxidase family protein